MSEQLLPITLDAKNGLAYTEDYAPIRAMLKHEPSLTELVDAIERDALGLVADPTDKEGNRQIRENADWVKKCSKRLEKIRTEAVADLLEEARRSFTDLAKTGEGGEMLLFVLGFVDKGYPEFD